ncbi:MAG: thiol-disulfide oxidoreductase DCC family protein [Candidatus Methylacidiphilales bacterium]
MKKLTVLYDAECGLCAGLRDRLARTEQWVELEFLPLQSPEVESRFPGIERWHPTQRLVVVSDHGAVYAGAEAWIMVLYATATYREVAIQMSRPGMKEKAQAFCEFLSSHRHEVSRSLGLRHATEVTHG